MATSGLTTTLVSQLKRYEDAISDCEAVLAIDSGHWKACVHEL